MARELLNAQVTHVSYVDKGANQKRFFLTKSAEKPTFQKEVKVFINKEDEAQKLVYGVVYEPDVEDSHEDFMTATEIEKAAHGFLKDARNIDTQHDFNAGVGEVVESYIAPSDLMIGEEVITKGSWVLVTKASDEIWDAIQKGDYTGYSLAGTAETIEKKDHEKPIAKTSDEVEQAKGFFDLMKAFFTGEKIQKGEVSDRYDDNQKRRNLWAVWDGMSDTFYDSVWDNRTPDVADFERLEAGVHDFLTILQEIKSTDDIAKALENKPGKIRKGEDEMKAEDIQKAVTEALAPITERLDAIEKEVTPKEPETVEKNAELDSFKAVLKEAMEPISTRLEVVEKARGVSNQADPDNYQGEAPIQKGYMRHFG
ncbi:XkdF-like putative serine protease domain-containing protein [Sporosarcina sp. P17b]|uniref:XkdF-like putative serine protease domain-containing protein n=1 Tax=Sporosarcina sp. P17b TaxID=2048260 RepID=UPI000C1627FE|nr:XkdF-like putative serine protease domain-containing protein [Sporosarcina sp. P17b]PIC72525.1 terminase [Sporosarcina sp. P17b]